MTVLSKWYVWITAVSDTYAEALAGRLVSHGWTISPLGKTITVTVSDSGCAVISLNIEKNVEEVDLDVVVEELKATMKLLRLLWISLVVTEPGPAARWSINDLPRIEKKDDEEDRMMH